MTKKLYQEFSWTESRILGALSRLGELLLNPPTRVHSGPVPETPRNSSTENQRMNVDGSQNDPHPEVGVFLSQSSHELGPEETSYRHELSIFPASPQIFV